MTIYHSCVNGDYSSTVITIAVFLLLGSVFLNIFVLIDWLIDWLIYRTQNFRLFEKKSKRGLDLSLYP